MLLETTLRAPSEATAALYFLPGQYLFKQIEAGRETAKALSSAQISLAFREHKTDTGWLNRKVLRYREEPAGNLIVSCEPAGIKRIWLENKSGELESINVPLPTLLLLGKAKEYYLWATTDKTVSLKSLLALAPLPNVGGSLHGKVCFGGNETPECAAENIDSAWNLIFGTPFNSHQTSGKCKSHEHDVRELLFGLAERRAKRFPKSELVKSEVTLGRIWEHLAEDKTLYRF